MTEKIPKTSLEKLEANYIKFRYDFGQYRSKLLKPFYYWRILPGIKKIAREHGYAVAIHGSMKRDFDLLIVPWTEDITPFEEFLEILRRHLGKGARLPKDNDHKKPHGRTSYILILPFHKYIHGAYLDIATYGKDE